MSQKEYSFECMGQTLKFNGPETADDIDRILSKPGYCADAAMQLYCYHDRGPALRLKVAEAIEEVLSQKDDFSDEDKRKFSMSPSKREGGDPLKTWDESETKYENRIVAAERLTQAEVNQIKAEVNDSLGDWSPNGTKESKPSKAVYAKADEVLAKIAAGKRTQEDVIQKAEAYLGISFESSYGAFNRDNYARAVRDIAAKATEEARRQQQAALDL